MFTTILVILMIGVWGNVLVKSFEASKFKREKMEATTARLRNVKINNPDHPYEWTFTNTKVGEPEYHFVDRSGNEDSDGSGSSSP